MDLIIPVIFILFTKKFIKPLPANLQLNLKNLKNHDEAKSALYNWIVCAENENIPEFKSCITAFKNWFGYILNSFRYNKTNGYTEGMNNNIKVLKRIAYGYKNFSNLRKRILLCFG